MGMSDEEEAVYEDLKNLKSLLKQTGESKVVLIGDIMMDCYIHGYANNLNSRAPVLYLDYSHSLVVMLKNYLNYLN